MPISLDVVVKLPCTQSIFAHRRGVYASQSRVVTGMCHVDILAFPCCLGLQYLSTKPKALSLVVGRSHPAVDTENRKNKEQIGISHGLR